jgi:V/A-type H+-transporting ATPase subunit D
MANILNIPPTRSELFALKNKIKLAVKGHSLLKKKRDALMKQFMEIVKDYRGMKQKMHSSLQDAYRDLTVAQALSGQFRVKSIAIATKNSLDISYTSTNTMGVKLQKLQLQEIENEEKESVGPSVVLSRAKSKLKKVLKDILKLSELEQNIQILSKEIINTKRRVNALEYDHIPKMKETTDFISFKLGEMERETFTMLKSIKGKMENEA